MDRFKLSHKKSAPQSALPTPSSFSQIQPEGQMEPDLTPLPTVEQAQAALKHSRAYYKLMGVCRGFVQLVKVVEPCLEGTPFKAVASVVIIIAEAVMTVKDTKDGADALLESLSERLSMVADHFARSENRNSQTVAEDFIKELARDAEEISRMRHAPNMKVLDAKKLKSQLEEVVKHVDRALGNFNMRILLEIERDTKRICDRLLNGNFDRWNRAPSARFKADTVNLGYTRQACTEGTRVDVLNRIYKWATDTSSPSIFWLCGMAGSGKSTIAYSVCKYFSVKNTAGASLGASFFCSRQVADLRRLGNIIPTIAYQLAHHSSSYAQALDHVDPNVVDISSEQVEKLLLEPWAGFANKRGDELPLNVIVIDALDEIEEEGGVQLLKDLIDAIHKLRDDCKRQLKILVTSRPHPRIVEYSAGLCSDSVYHLEDIKKTDGLGDILTFLKNKLPDLAADHPGLLKTLTNRSDGLFIYAATVVRVLFPPDSFHPLSPIERQKALSRFLQDASGSDFSDLDTVYSLYKQVLLEAIPKKQRPSRLPILHRIICALQPLSINALARLADDNFEDHVDVHAVTLLVQALHSVLYVSKLDGCVYVYHKSFSDFLLDDKLSGLELACNLNDDNAALSRACFRLMRSSLHFNMCSLPSSYLLDSEVPDLSHSIKTNILDITGLEYVCRFWVLHTVKVTKLSEAARDLLKLLPEFINERALFWIEVMNLLGAKSSCYDGLRDVAAWAESQSDLSLELKKLLRVTIRFAQSFLHTAASLSTPHLYISCLAAEFGINPDSLSEWKARFPGLPRIRYTETGNQGRILTNIEVGAAVYSVAFSPDGIRVVSGSSDKSVRIWDASTGAQLQQLNGHTDGVDSVAFSSDGTRVVSGSGDNSVRIWDASTGVQLHTLHGHTSYGRAVAFSPNGRLIISVSDDFVYIWDASTGAQLHELDGYADRCWFESAAFSSNGTHVVAVTYESDMLILNASTGVQLHKLIGYTSWFKSVAFSSDGARIAASSEDHSVCIWDASTEEQLHELNGHTSLVLSVAFSPDGTTIVSGSYDHSVRIWDVSTGVQLHKLNSQTGVVQSVAFSPDGTRVVSGSYDRFSHTAYIWDASTGAQLHKLNGDAYGSLSFSPDGTLVRSMTERNSVRIWDASTGAQLYILDGQTGSVWSIPFSSNGTGVVTGSTDESVRVWEASTERLQEELEGEVHSINSIALSPDGRRVMAGLEDGGVRIWDASAGAHLYKDSNQPVASLPSKRLVESGSEDGSVQIWDTSETTQMHEPESPVEYVMFLPGGTRIAGYAPFLVYIWDARTGAQLCQLHGNTDWDGFGALSPDGTRIAFAGYKEILISDTLTGAELCEMDGHTDMVNSVAFSTDGARIVSGSSDHSVRIWHASTGTQLCQLDGHKKGVNSVAFSTNGTRIVSGSHDHSVRIWDASTGAQLCQLDGHADGVRSVAFSPDGMRIMSRSDDHSVRIWDTSTGAQLSQLVWYTGRYESVAFSPDGTRVVSSFKDCSVRIWDASTGTQLQQLNGHTFYVCSVAFSPDGTRVVTASGDGSVRIWDALTGHGAQTTRWLSSESGWIVDVSSDQPMIWLPKHLSSNLQDGRFCERIISQRPVTLLDFPHPYFGPEWARCYQSL